MQRDKALLLTGDGLTFAGHLLNCFGSYGCKPVVLVVNEQFDVSRFQAENLVTLVNHHLEKGRSWSIQLGLKQVPEGYSCFIQNIDNPFLDPGLLDQLIGAVIPDGYAGPVCQGRGGHPILLGSKVVDFIRQQRELFDFRRVLQQFHRVEVSYPDIRILWNINTPDDYKEFIRWNRQSDKKL